MALTKAQRAALDALPPKRRAFVLALVGEAAGNQTRAAEIAGYADPEREGSRVRRFAKVDAAIVALQAPTENRAIASRAERLEWLSSVMRGEEDAQTRDRIKAAELIAKMSGDMVERREVEHTGNTSTIQVLIAHPDLVQLASGSAIEGSAPTSLAGGEHGALPSGADASRKERE